MKIGIVGGTGNMGRGLALRWARRHNINLGSRRLEKAVSVAAEYQRIARGFHGNEMQGSIQGEENLKAIKGVEVVVLTLPPQHTLETLEEIAPILDSTQIVVSTVVPMIKDGRLFRYAPLSEDQSSNREVSAAELIQDSISPIPVVSAFQNVPATYLADLDSVLNIDVLICGNDEDALQVVSKLVRDIPNLRPLRVGPLSNSKMVESLTPLLMNAAILNRLKDPSIRIVPWLPSDFQEGQS